MKTNSLLNKTLRCLKEIILDVWDDLSIRWIFIIAIILLFIGIVANLFLPYLLKLVIETLDINGSSSIIIFLIVGYGLIWMFSQVMKKICLFLTYKMEQRVTFLLGRKVLSHLYSLSHSYFINQKPGAIANIIRRAQMDVPNIMLGIFFHVLPILLEFILMLVGIAFFYTFTHMLILAIILLTFFAYTMLGIKKVMRLREEANNIDREVDGVVTDWISNYEAIKTFGRSDFAMKVCNKELKRRENCEVSFLKEYTLLQVGQSIILGLGLILLTLYVGSGVMKGELKLGDFVLFNGYVMQFIEPIGMLGHIIQNVKKALLDMQGIVEVLSTKSEVNEIVNPKLLEGTSFSIEFREVSFSYGKRKVLDKLSFKACAGETLVILGRTGIGKSTIAKLLLRLYDPSEGEIFINDVNVKELSIDYLYTIVSWVPQESYLLNDSIMNNVNFVCTNNKPAEVKKALEKVHLAELIKELPEGIDTIVGDRGVKLSGGEKQRLAIARILLKNPKICVFDESTSALDKKTEGIIQTNVEQYMPGMTKIIITHRSYLVNKVDQVVELGY